MSAGVPVIASASGGLPDSIEDGASGRLVPPGDAEALGRAVERLFADAAERERLGDGGRRRVRESFGVERMVGAHVALYLSLLGGRDAARADPPDAECPSAAGAAGRRRRYRSRTATSWPSRDSPATPLARA